MNKRKILRVLRRARSLTQGMLVKGTKTPERCVIGELLHAEGVSNAEMRLAGHYGESTYYKILKDTYDLMPEDTSTLVGFNDGACRSSFAKECKFSTPNAKGAQKRRNQARVCVVVKEIQRM